MREPESTLMQGLDNNLNHVPSFFPGKGEVVDPS